MKNLNFNREHNKKIYVLINPKKLLNKYFFYFENFYKINMFKKIIFGLPKFIWNIAFNRTILFEFHNDLPKPINIKQKLINFYSLIFFSFRLKKYSSAIFIIGDQLNTMNKGLLQSIERSTNIEVWIVNQGSGSISEKINLIYSKNVSRVYFPFSRESDFEKNLLEKANLKNDIQFLNIDTSLKLNISSASNKLAIFNGYDKKKRIFPFFFLYILSELMQIIYLKEFKKFDYVDIFLHPRLRNLLLLNYIKFNKNLSLKIFDDSLSYVYSFIICYSPTIDSSIINKTRKNSKYIKEYGKNFNRKNVQEHIKNLKNSY